MRAGLKFVVIVFLLLLLTGATCTFPPQLLHHFAVSNNPFSSLYLAAKDNVKARNMLYQAAIENQNAYWIRKGASLANQYETFELAMATEQTVLKLELLRLGAKQGHAPSQLNLALLSQRPETRMRWLTRAAEQGNTEAIQRIVSLAQAQNNIPLRNYWLPKAAEFDESLLIDYVKDVWLNTSPENAIALLKESAFNHTERVQSVLQKIESHRIDKNVLQRFKLAESCNLVIQFVAQNLDALAQANMFIEKYMMDDRFQGFSLCFNSPIWVDPKLLDCSNDMDARLSCGMQAISNLAETIPFTHAVVIAQNGIANVHNGMMYLDKQDDYFVFVHELAHFAGFVDEYPLSLDLAKNVCIRGNAPNLVFSNGEVEIADTHFVKFSKNTLNLTKTRTCDQLELTAFKPVNTLTFMEFHDTGAIPQIYLDIWKKTIQNPEALTPIYVNLAQWYESIEQPDKAQVWWERYHQFQSSTP